MSRRGKERREAVKKREETKSSSSFLAQKESTVVRSMRDGLESREPRCRNLSRGCRHSLKSLVDKHLSTVWISYYRATIQQPTNHLRLQIVLANGLFGLLTVWKYGLSIIRVIKFCRESKMAKRPKGRPHPCLVTSVPLADRSGNVWVISTES